MRTDQAELLLRRFAQEVHTQLTEQGHATIRGIGTFTTVDTGLSFVPDNALLNAAWVAEQELKPVTVLVDNTFLEQVPPANDAQQPGKAEASAPSSTDSDPLPQPESENAPVGLPGPGAPAKKQLSSPPAAKRPGPTPLGTRTVRQRRKPWSHAVLGTLAIGIVLAGLWGTIAFWPGGEESENITSTEDSTTATTPPPLEPADASSDPSRDDAVEEEEREAGSVPSEAAQDDAAPPPSVNEFDHALGGYALIVGSLSEYGAALREMDRFRRMLDDPGIPVGIMRSRDRTRFRVAVGQQSTIEGVLALKAAHASLPDDSWVLRIRANSRPEDQ